MSVAYRPIYLQAHAGFQGNYTCSPVVFIDNISLYFHSQFGRRCSQKYSAAAICGELPLGYQHTEYQHQYLMLVDGDA